MTVIAALPSSYIQQLGELVDDLGGDFETCLAVADISREALDVPLLELPLSRFITVISEALKQTRKPELGLLLGERLLVHTHGVLGYAAMNAETLRDALKILEQFIQVRVAFVHLAFNDDASCLSLTSNLPLGDADRLLMEAILLAIKQIIDFITQEDEVVSEVCFHIPTPANAQLASTIFQCPVTYECDISGFKIRSEYLDRSLRVADPAAYEMAQKLCQQALAELGDKYDLSQKIQRYLLERHNEFPTLEQICRQLYLTPRTLHRRLQDEGTSYRAIVEDVKHQLAIGYLREGQNGLQEIAYLLGYSDVANFRRAFKRWEGVPPTTYLKQIES